MGRHFDVRLATAEEMMVDEPCSVLIRDCIEGEPVDVAVTCDYGVDGVWRANASFIADDHGEVDVARQAPVSGDWAGDGSGHGPWWSARLVSTSARDHGRLVPTVVEVRGTSTRGQTRAEFVRARSADRVG